MIRLNNTFGHFCQKERFPVLAVEKLLNNEPVIIHTHAGAIPGRRWTPILDVAEIENSISLKVSIIYFTKVVLPAPEGAEPEAGAGWFRGGHAGWYGGAAAGGRCGVCWCVIVRILRDECTFSAGSSMRGIGPSSRCIAQCEHSVHERAKQRGL